MNNHFNKRGRNNHQRRRQGVNPNRALDSNGPDVRIRGTAQQIYDKYLALARDASSSGDRVKAENYLQHAEHYFRVLRAVQGPQAQPGGETQQQDGDFDGGDQPAIGDQQRDFRDQREFRNERQSQPQPQPQAEADDGDASASDEQPFEQQPNGSDDGNGGERRAQEGQGQSQGQGQSRGDADSRRRRRRPRRPREDGGSSDATDDAPEPVGAK